MLLEELFLADPTFLNFSIVTSSNFSQYLNFIVQIQNALTYHRVLISCSTHLLCYSWLESENVNKPISVWRRHTYNYGGEILWKCNSLWNLIINHDDCKNTQCVTEAIADTERTNMHNKLRKIILPSFCIIMLILNKVNFSFHSHAVALYSAYTGIFGENKLCLLCVTQEIIYNQPVIIEI